MSNELIECICKEAMTWVGTPFRANAKVKGIGADCVGVVMGTFEACGIDLNYRSNYSVRPDGTLRREIERRLNRVKDGTRNVCDVLLIAYMHEEPHHIALYVGEGYIVHAYAQARKCVYQKYDIYWQQATRARYRLPSLT